MRTVEPTALFAQLLTNVRVGSNALMGRNKITLYF